MRTHCAPSGKPINQNYEIFDKIYAKNFLPGFIVLISIISEKRCLWSTVNLISSVRDYWPEKSFCYKIPIDVVVFFPAENHVVSGTYQICRNEWRRLNFLI